MIQSYKRLWNFKNWSFLQMQGDIHIRWNWSSLVIAWWLLMELYTKNMYWRENRYYKWRLTTFTRFTWNIRCFWWNNRLFMVVYIFSKCCWVILMIKMSYGYGSLVDLFIVWIRDIWPTIQELPRVILGQWMCHIFYG